MSLTFGERVVVARGRARLSQGALGRALGLHRNTVAQWEADHSKPDGATMVKLPGVLGVSGHWLLTGDGSMDLPDGSETVRLRVIGIIAGGRLSQEAAARLQEGRLEAVAGVLAEMLATPHASGK